jgi:hypothetical protein
MILKPLSATVLPALSTARHAQEKLTILWEQRDPENIFKS